MIGLISLLLIAMFFIPGLAAAILWGLFMLVKGLFMFAFRFWQVTLFVFFIMFLASLF